MLQLRLRGQRMWELERTFARDRMAISRFTRDLSREIHTRWRHLLTWDGWMNFAAPRMEAYVQALNDMGAPQSMRLCAFVDGWHAPLCCLH